MRRAWPALLGLLHYLAVTTNRTTALALATLLALPAGLAGCGDDDGTAAPTETTAAEDGVAADEGGYGSGCRPVGEDLEGDATETVDVQLDDYTFIPPELEVAAGVVTFAAENVGEESHELAFLPGGGDVPLTEDGAPDEEALAEAGAFELEAFPAGETCNATYELEAGEYTLFCIVVAEDGETHLEKGMVGSLTVG